MIKDEHCLNDIDGSHSCNLCLNYGCLYGRMLYQVTDDGRIIEFMIGQMALNLGDFNVKFKTILISPNEDWSREYHQANLEEVYVSRLSLVHYVFSNEEQAVKYINNDTVI